MILHMAEPYLWFPVKKEKPEVKLHLYRNGEKIQELDIHLGGFERDFYVAMDAGNYLGEDIEIKGDVPEEMLFGIFCYGENVQNVYPFRPHLHFSPEIGWQNDPNGLVYADGLYHLYYQWNPYGVNWGNMHWGHGVSRDLIRWEHRPMAIAPDEYGTIFSGSGWLDQENKMGCGKDALLFYYTAAGGKNQWSADKGNRFTQRLRISTDGGETLQRSDQFLMEHVAGENRDPNVFYHEKSGAYIMLLYLDGYEFAIYRSKDLLKWKESSRFSMQGMWECPDLFELNVENRENETKWVFWSADGFYVVGDFDGYRFIQEQKVQMAYSTKLPYAAQTYAGVKDRVISIAWLRMDNDRGNYRGLMSLPTELSLVKKEERYQLRFQPVRELWKLRQPFRELEKGQIKLNGVPVELLMEWKPQKEGQTKLCLGNMEMVIDFSRGIIRLKERDIVEIPFSREETLDLALIIDQEVVEFFGKHGIIYGAVEMEENILRKTLTVKSSVEFQSVQWCELS